MGHHRTGCRTTRTGGCYEEIRATREGKRTQAFLTVRNDQKLDFSDGVPELRIIPPKDADKPVIMSATKLGAGDEVNVLVSYAYDISQNKDFVLTLGWENGLWQWDRVNHAANNTNGHRDVGMCMLNRQWHHEFIDSEEFKDPYKQLDYCWEVYQDGVARGRITTTFYGYNHRLKLVGDYEFITAS